MNRFPWADMWPILWPALAVAALRMTDVSLNVVKTVFVVKGRRLPAALVSGLEATTWLSAAGIVFAEPSLTRAVGFVVGVSLGTFLGVSIMDRAKLGMVTVRAFVSAGENRELAGHIIAERIRRAGFGATVFDGYGKDAQVHMVLAVVHRKDAERVCEVARRADPRAFVMLDSDPGPGSAIRPMASMRV